MYCFKSIRWETPRHLPNREIHIRFSRLNPKSCLIVYYKGERMGEARRLDPVANTTGGWEASGETAGGSP